MLVYNVFYPKQKAFDRDVSWRYLERLAKERSNEGAVANCTNGPRERLVLRSGEWVEEKR